MTTETFKRTSEHWYFAYGSNMTTSRLEKRIGRCSIKWQTGYVDGYTLTFDKPAGDGTGFAMIASKSGERVYGVLYLLTATELAKLDRHEGVPKHYVRDDKFPVILLNAQTVLSHCYLPVKVVKDLCPRPGYLEWIIQGAREHALPDDYQHKLECYR